MIVPGRNSAAMAVQRSSLALTKESSLYKKEKKERY